MLRHNIVLFFRNLKKDKSTFFINLIGLSTGLVSVLLIYLWVTDEMAIDKYHRKGDYLYQVLSNHSDANGIRTFKGVPGLLLEEIQASVPEVSHAVATTDSHEYTLSLDGGVALKSKGKFASKDFFEVFTYPMIEGDPRTVLSNTSGILITESLAKRLFQSTDVLGRSIDWHFWDESRSLEITGILQDLPEQTSEKFDFLMSWDYYHDNLINFKGWGNYYGRIHVVLHDKAAVDVASVKIDKILKENQKKSDVSLFLGKHADRYLYSKYENGKQAGGRIDYIRLFTIVALFILFIACINFINLSTAKASQRVREIGAKKTFGASRTSLMFQFYTESMLLGIFSLFIALLLVYLLLPQFNMLSQKELSLNFSAPFYAVLLSIIIAVGILAGSYPALHLSGFKVVKAIKGDRVSKKSEIWGRKALVVAQFILSIILIVGVGVVHFQLDYVKSKNLGYDRENIVYLEREGKLLTQTKAFVEELKNIPGVEGAVSSGFMVGGGNATGGVSWPGKTNEDQVQFWEIRSGHGTLDLMNIELAEGRDFSEEFISDEDVIIVNEKAVEAMGLKDPIGKTITHYLGDKKIVGVVKDFHLTSLHLAVEPTLFLYRPDQTHFVMAKLGKFNEAQTLDKIEELYAEFNPGYPFQPKFLDQDYQALYASEERVSSLSKYFAGLAILISCLGLLGLATYTAERRTKEIGIRKILGSSVLNIMYLLTGDFTKMVMIAIIIAVPISYYTGTAWLENFTYKIDFKWWSIAVVGAGILLVSWVIVGWQTIKAAFVNPIQSLKTE